MKTPIIFNIALAAGVARTTASRRISYPFRITKIRLNFPIGSEYEIEVLVFISDDAMTANDTVPNGIDIFRILNIEKPAVGNAEVIEMNCDIKVAEGDKYIHVYVLNNDTNAHKFMAVVEIESLERRH
ncbi:MAG: hypothetical protein H8E11_04400 [Candidatus Cloacimonetes bacterium]|nr:hypothetical protein [Candidatus Cloacimonadota bacterium]